MSRKSSQGFTVVEVLVGIGILLIAFVSALSVLNLVDRGQKSNEDSLSYASARNKIVSLLLDDTSWARILTTPGNVDNPNFSCLVKQDSSNISDRDCYNATAPLVMYNIKGQKYVVDGIEAYDFRSATQGISAKGQACNSFVAAPAAGNPQCPYQVVLTWKALCASSPCVNPPILFSGVTAFNGNPDQLNPNLANLNFQVIKSRMYCPPLDASNTPATHLPATDVDVSVVGQVRSSLATDVPTTAFAKTDVAMAPCRRIMVSFTEDLSGTFAVNANNSSEVSIQDESSGAKVFQFRRIALGATYDYQLLYNGTVVAGSKPSWITLTAASVFKFDITDGLVRFCIDDRCPYYFTQKLDFPFRMTFKPASNLHTPGGFKNIVYSLTDL